MPSRRQETTWGVQGHPRTFLLGAQVLRRSPPCLLVRKVMNLLYSFFQQKYEPLSHILFIISFRFHTHSYQSSWYIDFLIKAMPRCWLASREMGKYLISDIENERTLQNESNRSFSLNLFKSNHLNLIYSFPPFQ